MNPTYSESVLNCISQSLSYKCSVKCLIDHGYEYEAAISLLDDTIKMSKIFQSLNDISYV